MQRPMLYLPTGAHTPSPPPGVDAVSFDTHDGVRLEAWWFPADGEQRATAIAFPGNAGTRADRTRLGRMLAERGVGALLVDYRGYAGHDGRPSETGLRRDARAARAWLDRHSEDTGPLLYLGESLGSAVAAGLASEQPPDGLLLRSPFPSLAEAAAAAYRLPGVPAWLLPDRYPVAEQVAGLDGVAVAVLAGAEDTIVPSVLSAAVADAAGVELRLVEHAGHNDPVWLDGEPLRAAVERLLRDADTQG